MMSKKLFLLLVLSGPSVHSSFGADLDGPSTTFSSPINFCNVKAKEAISELDKLGLGKVDDINKIKAEINDINARKNLIGGFLKIRDEFTASFKEIKDRQKSFDKNISNNLDSFKTLLKTSMTLSAVNMIAKTETSWLNIPGLAPKGIRQLCAENKNDTHLCRHINEKIWDYSNEIEALDKTLINAYQAMGNIVEQQNARSDLQKIYNSIPSPISPDKILGDLMKNSPNLVAALDSSNDKETITNCLSNMSDDNHCKKLLSDSNSRESLKTVLTAEMNTVQKDFAEKKFDHFFKQVQDSAPKAKEEIRNLMNSKASDLANYLEEQLTIDSDKAKKLEISAGSIETYKAACIQKENEEFDLQDCIKYSKSISAFFENEESINNEKLQDAVNRLDKVVNDKGSIESIEKMKQYVAQKYMRTCRDAKEKDIVSNITCPCLNENDMGTNLPSDKSQLGQLNLRLSSVIGKLRSPPSISTQRGELGPFSKSELEVYKNYCQNTSLPQSPVTGSICRDIYSESNQIAHLKETQEWDEFNKKYWVEYSKTSKRGYDVYEKKGNARIFGEGLSQSINTIYPVWLGNFQLTNQITMMTNQALYQKQMNYVYSPNSPWMTIPYFQGSYFPTATTNLPTKGFSF